MDPSITQEHLVSLFLPFGPIVDVLLPMDNAAKQLSKGFADVQFEHIGDAEAAIDNMEGAEVYGKVLRVRRSVKQGPAIDSKKAIWEQAQVTTESDPSITPQEEA